jgi:hypothetical protein
MVEALSEADRFFLNLAFKRANEKQNMSKRTIDETGKDVPQQRSRQVREVLCVRPCPVMGLVAEWVPMPCVGGNGWSQTLYVRTRFILDNES